MKLIHKYDSKTKLYTEDELINADASTDATAAKTYTIPPNATDIQPIGFHAPKWSGTKWAEGDVLARDTFNSGLVATQYQRDRAAEYPPQADYLDAIVKSDTVAQQAYIDACLAVKAKFPKPL